MDGGEEGEVEEECYFAANATIAFTGRVIHPGYARGKLVNAVNMACSFVEMMPRSESPEATDGRYGNFWPGRIEGQMEEASLTVLVRDFERSEVERRLKALRRFGQAVEAAYPGGRVRVETKYQYLNMKEKLDQSPRVLELLKKAVSETGMDPKVRIIRGGTDGAWLTEMGVPTPNVFTGGHNYHSRTEWVALPAMERACQVVVNLVRLWGTEEG